MEKKTHHVLLIISLIIFLRCHITHGLKNQGLWIRKLNGKKKKSEIKKMFYWERDVFKPSKAKKAIIYKRRMILDLFQKSEA